MATRFVAPVITLALLIIVSSLGKPPPPPPVQNFVVSAEKPAAAYICRKRIVALNTQIDQVTKHEYSF